MANHFEPRRILKQISNSLLRDFFTRRGELLEVPWNDLAEHRIEPVLEAWQGLPERKFNEVQMVLREIDALADHRGVAVLAETVAARFPQRRAEFAAIEGMHDKAMWVYLNLHGIFEECTYFAQADALQAGGCWKQRNGLPKTELVVTPEMRAALRQALVGYFGPTQLRGRRCQVVHYRRPGGVDYFFAYLDDYPDRDFVFEDGCDSPAPRSVRHAFQVVIAFDGGSGTLAAYAKGGMKIWNHLQVIFCSAILGRSIDPAAPQRPVFHLDAVLSRAFPLSLEPTDGVEGAWFARMRIAKRFGGGYIELKADPKAGPGDIYDKLEAWIADGAFTPGVDRVLQATISLRLTDGGKGRPATMTFDVNAPNSCNLKGKTDEQRIIGERCLRRWGIINDN